MIGEEFNESEYIKTEFKSLRGSIALSLVAAFSLSGIVSFLMSNIYILIGAAIFLFFSYFLTLSNLNKSENYLTTNSEHK